VRPSVTVGARERSEALVTILARLKSRTFTAPSGVILMLLGFRSRWTIPFEWAASSASAICFAIGRAS
jgi:hypothetical protein